MQGTRGKERYSIVGDLTKIDPGDLAMHNGKACLVDRYSVLYGLRRGGDGLR